MARFTYTVDDFLNEVLEYVKLVQPMPPKVLKFQTLARRYGKKASHTFGKPLLTLIREDKRFVTTTTRDGGFIVCARRTDIPQIDWDALEAAEAENETDASEVTDNPFID